MEPLFYCVERFYTVHFYKLEWITVGMCIWVCIAFVFCFQYRTNICLFWQRTIVANWKGRITGLTFRVQGHHESAAFYTQFFLNYCTIISENNVWCVREAEAGKHSCKSSIWTTEHSQRLNRNKETMVVFTLQVQVPKVGHATQLFKKII